MFAEGLWEKIIVTGTVAALGHAIGDRYSDIRISMVQFFTAAIAQGALQFILQDIPTKMFAEGLWDKIFVTGTVVALGRALDDEDYEVRASIVIFYTAAMAQGALHCFHGVFIPNYLQAVFGTRYLSLRQSRHLEMH